MFYEISFQFALLLLTFILYQIKVKSFPELLPAPEVESVCCLDCFGKKGSAMTHITRRSFLKASVARRCRRPGQRRRPPCCRSRRSFLRCHPCRFGIF